MIPVSSLEENHLILTQDRIENPLCILYVFAAQILLQQNDHFLKLPNISKLT